MLSEISQAGKDRCLTEVESGLMFTWIWMGKELLIKVLKMLFR